MNIFIDGHEADVSSDTGLSLSVSAQALTEPDKCGFEPLRGITIPMTDRNRTIMGHCEEIHAAGNFGDRVHTVRIEEEGCLLAEGSMRLTGCVLAAGGMEGYYRFDLLRPKPGWAECVSSLRLPELFQSYAAQLSAAAVMDSWTSDSAVRYLPVLREKYDPHNGEASIAPPARILTMSDYHPFIRIADVVQEVFSQAGYSVFSDFFDGELFGSLHMSGNYPETDVEPLKAKMDFCAGRFGSVSSTANYLGRVVANPYSNYNTIGNLVETADPDEVRNGVRVEGVFSNGGCFRAVDQRMAFVPASKITMGFRYTLKYVTAYRIKNGSELTGFNTFYMGNNQTATFSIPNRFEDQKHNIQARMNYRCIVPGYSTGTYYRLTCKMSTSLSLDPDNPVAGDWQTLTLADFTGGSTTVMAPFMASYADPVLYYGTSPSAINNVYTGEWLLYFSYVGETGLTDVEVAFTSAPHEISPSSPKYFDDHFFGGAEEGMAFTLSDCKVTPVFEAYPAVGSAVSFADVAAHDISAMEVIAALKHMFNLSFYTDERTKTVRIEPADGLRSGVTVDWSGRIDYSKPLSIAETGGDGPKTITYCYKGGDGAVNRYNTANSEKFGSWSRESAAALASGTRRYENPLFTPSVNSAASFAAAMSASWLNVGGRSGTDSSDALNFPAKIVSYRGMRPLPGGERWSWPSGGGEYPLLTFHESGEGVTLCFEDRDGLRGLNRFHERTLEAADSGRRLTLWLRLMPHEVEALLCPNSMGHDFRARFMFTIAGEAGYWRLEEVCAYDPEAPSTKCVFAKER